jgi:hypothetical protein
LVALLARVRPWRSLVAVLAGIVAFGFAAHAVVGAVSHSATAGHPGSTGWIATLVRHYAIVPHNPTSYGNVLFVVLICALIGLMRLHGARRLIAIVPTVYAAVCCWEARLTLDPSITAQIMLGAILIVVMAARPQGLLGTHRVETL